MKKIILLFSAIIFASCSSTRIPLKKEFWNGDNGKIGIVFSEDPIPGAYKSGAQGLLDMAINEAMSATLEEHLESLDVEEFRTIQEIFTQKFKEKGINNILFLEDDTNGEELKIYKKNIGKSEHKNSFFGFKEKYDIDYLIVFSISRYGTIRSYYGFIPLGPPKGLFEANGMLVNLKTNQYEWYVEMEEEESSSEIMGEWDEEPDYPNLTNAIYEALHSSQKFLQNHFFDK